MPARQERIWCVLPRPTSWDLLRGQKGTWSFFNTVSAIRWKIMLVQHIVLGCKLFPLLLHCSIIQYYSSGWFATLLYNFSSKPYLVIWFEDVINVLTVKYVSCEYLRWYERELLALNRRWLESKDNELTGQHYFLNLQSRY